jgi:adenylate cyclase
MGPRGYGEAWRRLGVVLAAALPLIGLASLLLRRELDPHFENYRAHFVVFGIVGAVAFILGYAAGEAANRRGDARVLLLSLAFMATGGFLGLHAIGTPQILFSKEYSGFMVAIPVGLSSALSLLRRPLSSTSALGLAPG